MFQGSGEIETNTTTEGDTLTAIIYVKPDLEVQG